MEKLARAVDEGSYYHNSREQAVAAGLRAGLAGFDVRAELEPDNGWVTVLVPTGPEAFAQPLSEVLGWAEVDLTAYPRLRQRPACYRRAQLAARPAKPAVAGPVTWKPGKPFPWKK